MSLNIDKKNKCCENYKNYYLVSSGDTSAQLKCGKCGKLIKYFPPVKM